MNLKTWFMTHRQLQHDNDVLFQKCVQFAETARNLTASLNHMGAVNQQAIEDIRNEAMTILGAIALQHQGEIVVKDEFMQMLNNPEYSLKVSVEKDEANNCLVIKAIQLPKEENVEPEK